MLFPQLLAADSKLIVALEGGSELAIVLERLEYHTTMLEICKRMDKSIFYDIMKTTEELAIYDSVLSPAMLQIVAFIAATSPALHTVDMRNSNLGKYGPDISTALAKSTALHTVSMRSSNLGEYATATALAKSPVIHTINLSQNEIRTHCPT